MADGTKSERVIPGTRRPDGTIRKEIRIRPGYTPQDEVAVYEARGSRPRNSGPVLPPGLDPAYAAQVMARKSKSAKKNEKRKEKKTDGDTPSINQSEPSASLQRQMDNLAISDPLPAVKHAVVEPVRASEESTNGGKLEIEKKIRNLRKKIRQAETLEASIASRAGGQVSAEEQDKISRLSKWRIEVDQLEKDLAKP